MNELEERIKNSKVIDILVDYLEEKNLIGDIVNHIFVTIQNGEITDKINHYRDLNGNVYNLYEINKGNLDKDDLEKMTFYRCEEIKKLYFDNNLVEEKRTINKIASKCYNQIKKTYQPLKNDDQLLSQRLYILIKEYPCLFIEIILNYNIDINELINRKNKKLVLN